MRKARLFAVLALAVPSMPWAAGAVPLVGELQAGIAWSPGTPSAGVTVTFTTTASDGDGAINFARMCWGDGKPCGVDTSSPTLAEQAMACVIGDNWTRTWTHKYTAPGDYFFTLLVTSRGCPGLPDESKTVGYTIHVS